MKDLKTPPKTSRTHEEPPALQCPTQMSANDLIAWLDAVVRAYGNDIPIWLVHPQDEFGTPTCTPLRDGRLQKAADGHRAIVLSTERL